jgi:preprotein translocase subunit SecE
LARDRKRAKQRRERRGTTAGGRRAGAGPERGAGTAATPSQPTRANVPGALDHASGVEDEFEAAIVRGAEGVVATPEPAAGEPEPAVEQTEPAAGEPEPAVEEPERAVEEPELADEDGSAAELERESPDELELLPAEGGRGDGRGGDDGGAAVAAGGRERPAPGAPLREGNRAIAFLRASWAELQRVQWPDRRQVTQATAVVLGFVAIAGAYLGLADFVAKEIVEFVL